MGCLPLPPQPFSLSVHAFPFTKRTRAVALGTHCDEYSPLPGLSTLLHPSTHAHQAPAKPLHAVMGPIHSSLLGILGHRR